MVTTWAAESEDEHRLMGRVMRALFRFPTLPEGELIGKLKKQRYEIGMQLARHDKLTNPAELWSALDNEIRPTICYIATLEINPWEEVSGPVVRTLTMRTQMGTKNGHQTLASEMINIGGTIFREKDPQNAIQVALKNTGFIDITNPDGRFRLSGIEPGEYTLVAWPPDSPPQEKAITVPSPDGSYDFDLN